VSQWIKFWDCTWTHHVPIRDSLALRAVRVLEYMGILMVLKQDATIHDQKQLEVTQPRMFIKGAILDDRRLDLSLFSVTTVYNRGRRRSKLGYSRNFRPLALTVEERTSQIVEPASSVTAAQAMGDPLLIACPSFKCLGSPVSAHRTVSADVGLLRLLWRTDGECHHPLFTGIDSLLMIEKKTAASTVWGPVSFGPNQNVLATYSSSHSRRSRSSWVPRRLRL
jgi:hypothetical protein